MDFEELNARMSYFENNVAEKCDIFFAFDGGSCRFCAIWGVFCRKMTLGTGFAYRRAVKVSEKRLVLTRRDRESEAKS